MKRLFQIIIVFALIFLISFETVNACTVHIVPLRKDYQQSKNVFLGEIISTERVENEELPEKLKGSKYLEKLIFKVHKSWKGNKMEVIVYSSSFCDYPMRQYDFSVGEKFLVFADKNSHFDICGSSNFQISKDKNKNSEEIIKRLDSFGFRLWARIYLF
jgi:hypothetical protein